jgi:hypothetical protein
MVDDETGSVDMMTALLAAWNAEEMEVMGTKVLPALLTVIRAQVPGEMETTFTDHERIPGYLFDDTWTGFFTTAELLDQYTYRLDSEARKKPRALVGLRCLCLLLFSFDTRMREFMWARHDVHGLLGTHDFDHNAKVRKTARVFVDPVKERARIFVADILLARQEDEPAIIERLASEFLDYALRFWASETEGLPWPTLPQ